MGKLRNRIVNTLGIAPRTVKTAARTTIDTTKSALNVVLDPFIGLWKTSVRIKDAIHKSFTEWPWYRKLWKVPTSLALSPLMAVEWVVETLRWTWVNACSSARDIIWNTLTNEWNAIKMIWRWEKFKFTTDKLEYKRLSPRNRLASLFWTKTEAEAEREHIKSKEKELKSQEEKFKKEREDWRNDRKAEQEKSRKEREDWRNSRKAEQEKYFETIKQERESLNKQKDEFNKRISLLEKEKKDLESALKDAKAEANEAKAKVVKFTPSVEKKEVNTEGKTAPIIKVEPKVEGKWATTEGEKVEIKKSA